MDADDEEPFPQNPYEELLVKNIKGVGVQFKDGIEFLRECKVENPEISSLSPAKAALSAFHSGLLELRNDGFKINERHPPPPSIATAQHICAELLVLQTIFDDLYGIFEPDIGEEKIRQRIGGPLIGTCRLLETVGQELTQPVGWPEEAKGEREELVEKMRQRSGKIEGTIVWEDEKIGKRFHEQEARRQRSGWS